LLKDQRKIAAFEHCKDAAENENQKESENEFKDESGDTIKNPLNWTSTKIWTFTKYNIYI
jgi:hypothetical protein